MIALNFFGIPYAQAALIILNLIIIESLLSVDNAAVLASMAMKLPKEQRGKALRYGIIGAYVFRGICLVLAVWLVHFWWLKLVGGAYLLFLSIKHFLHTEKENLDEIKEEADAVPKSKFYQLTVGKIGPFWGTVIAIEVMDLAFSLDNVLAAVAFTENLPNPNNINPSPGVWLLWIGVFIGILAMRFVAQGFVRLMEKFPFLETAAYAVICLLGSKLTFDGIITLIQKFFNPEAGLVVFMENESNKHNIDLIVSLTTIAIFVVPILFALIFRRQKPQEKDPS
jgi:YkoY family integral membrane protein